MEKLENITTKLKEQIEFCEQEIDISLDRELFSEAARWQARKEAYEKSIYIVNTLF